MRRFQTSMINMKTMNKLSAASFMVMAALFLSGCNDKNENTTVTTNATDKCNVESINGKTDAIVYVKRGTVEINGWAFDDAKHAVAQDLQIYLVGAQGKSLTAKDPEKIQRPDVAKVYNNKELTNSGFKFTVDTSSFVPGAYGITLKMLEVNTQSVCQSKKSLVIM